MLCQFFFILTIPLNGYNDCSFGEDLKSYNELQAQIERILLNPNLDNFQRSVQSAKLMQELYQYIAKPSIQLFNYISPLKEKKKEPSR